MLASVLTHPSNAGIRGRAVVRCGYHFAMTRLLGKTTTAPLGRTMHLRITPIRRASSRVVYGNPPDPEELAVWQRLIGDGDFFLDVGANIGIYTLLLHELGAEVVAIEPVQTNELRHNLALNQIDLAVWEVAVSDSCGEVVFATGSDQRNAILVGKADRIHDTTVVPSMCLDHLVPVRHIRGMKIDVEGHERRVLEGAAGILASQRVDFIQLEWNSECRTALDEDRVPVAELLAQYGYLLAEPTIGGALHACGPEVRSDQSTDLFAVAPRWVSLVLPDTAAGRR